RGAAAVGDGEAGPGPLGHVEHQPSPAAGPHGDGPGGASGVAEHDPRLVGPAVEGTAVTGRQQVAPGESVGRAAGAGPGPQLAAPAGVPQVPVQVQAEAAGGPWVRVPAGTVAQTLAVPQREAEPLSAVGPGG